MIVIICDINKLRVLGNIAIETGFRDTGKVISIRVVPNVVEIRLGEHVLRVHVDATS